MKIVVIGGTGLIGSSVVRNLTEQGHEAVAAAPNTGVNTLTGEGLAEVLAGAAVVVDVSNSPSFEDQAVLDFFTTSTTNLLEAERAAGVGHHVILSIVGSEDMVDSGYMRAKVAQERLVKGSGSGWSIVRATQFFEFSTAIADGTTVDGEVRLPHALYQPVAAADVAAQVAEVAAGAPLGGTVEIAGPEVFHFDEFIATALAARGDERKVQSDPDAAYFGEKLAERSLVPDEGAAVLGATTFEKWVADQ